MSSHDRRQLLIAGGAQLCLGRKRATIEPGLPTNQAIIIYSPQRGYRAHFKIQHLEVDHTVAVPVITITTKITVCGDR